MTRLEELIARRDALLESKPYLKPVQAKIDAVLKEIDAPLDRCYLLNQLMIANTQKLGELSEDLTELLGLLKDSSKDLESLYLSKELSSKE